MASGQSSLGSATGGGAEGGAAAASAPGAAYSNFSSVNDMLKGFMELQKEQLKVEQAKAEANKAKVDLAMDYEEGDYIPPTRYAYACAVEIKSNSKTYVCFSLHLSDIKGLWAILRQP